MLLHVAICVGVGPAESVPLALSETLSHHFPTFSFFFKKRVGGVDLSQPLTNVLHVLHLGHPSKRYKTATRIFPIFSIAHIGKRERQPPAFTPSMTPNLFLATQTLFSPHKWFKDRKSERPTRKTEHWDVPIPGIYEYIPGRGWYLIATDKNASTNLDPNPQVLEGRPLAVPNTEDPKETTAMTPPVPVRYSKVLKRYMLEPDYKLRKRHGDIEDSRGKRVQVGFFQLDDGIAWVQCWDDEGEFIPGPYKLWCIDARTNSFRHMLRKDDPDYQPSRQNSFDHDPSTRRRSQDSRSTQYRTSGPGTPRDGPSVPSSRANSIRGFALSNSSSQANSRRSSPKRSPSIPLEEAKAKLRAMAQAQAAAVRSSVRPDEVTRGRQPAVVKAASTPAS